MFLGHFALGFAAKRLTPRLSLAVLFVAAQLADVLWPIFILAGIEQVRIDLGNTRVTPLDFVSYPYSHSLVALVLWGLILGWLCRGYVRGLWVFAMIAALVVSHWVLDFATHRPDMPIYPGSPTFGLGLWNSVSATVATEMGLYAAGLWIYARSTRARDSVGRWAFAAFAVFLVVIYAGNLAGGPPPSVPILAASAIVGTFVLLLWSWWLDHHRAGIT